MSNKLKNMTQAYEQTLYDVMKSPTNWISFLNSATWNFGYSFSDKLCIYFQRPDAIACTTLDNWNRKAKRWVNNNAKGIALIKENNGITGLQYVFDVSDTHQYNKKEYKLWTVEKEYENDIIEALDNKFGVLESKQDLADALYSTACIMVEDNIQDYLSDLKDYISDSFLEDLDELNIEFRLRNLLNNSVTYMMMLRCNINPFDYFSQDDFRYIVDFNTFNTMIRLGNATSEIAELGISEIKRTVQNLQNHTFDKENKKVYSNNEIERSDKDDRSNIYKTVKLSNTEFNIGEEKERKDFIEEIRNNEVELSKTTQESTLSNIIDEKSIDRAFTENTRNVGEENGTTDEKTNSRRSENEESNGLDWNDEQFDGIGRRNSNERIDLQLDNSQRTSWKYEYNPNIKEFFDDETINDIVKNSPNVIKNLIEIKNFLRSNIDDRDKCEEYVSRIFNDAYTEYVIKENERVGYKTYKNGFYMWKGNYLNRTGECFRPWSTLTEHLISMLLLRELENIKVDLSNEIEQINFIEESEVDNTSVFVFPQEIIDKAIKDGSHFSEGKYRIYNQFQKSLSSKENINFLKNEYGIGGSSSVLSGSGIGEQYDSKGIKLYRGFGENAPTLLLPWSKIEQRIRELIKDDRYLTSKEKARFPIWLENQEQKELLSKTKQTLFEQEKNKSFPERLNTFFEQNDIFDTSEDERTNEEKLIDLTEELKNTTYIKNTIEYLQEVKRAEDNDIELSREIDYFVNELNNIYSQLEQ